MAKVSNPDVKTLEDLITYSNTSEYSKPNTDIRFKLDGVVVHDKHVYEKFRDVIMANVQRVALTKEEFEKYRYKPELVAKDLYGNPNLSHLVLYTNSCSEYTFDNNILLLLTPNFVSQIFKLMMIHEQSRINNNRNEIIA